MASCLLASIQPHARQLIWLSALILSSFAPRIWARADIVCKRMEIFAAASEFKYATLAFVISSRQGCENAADLSVD